jgi:hypothetical protein
MSGDAKLSELYSSLNGPAELHGDSAAGELESPENTPRPVQGEFPPDTAREQNHGLGVSVDERV